MPADNDSSSSQRDHRRSDPMAEHKRRARWRLLGALILVGAVAAVAPLLLEDQARPLSQDLLIEIPSRNSSFGKIDSLKPSATEETVAATEKSAASVETKTDVPAPVKEEPKASTQSKSAPESKPQTRIDTKVDTKVETKTEPKTEPKVESKLEPKKDSKLKKETVFVQVGAYAKFESANAIKTKLESGGHKVIVEPVKSADGAELYRVRIGPFDSRPDAEQVRDRARSQGYSTAAVVSP